MLDLNVTSMNNEKKTHSTQVRHGDSLAVMIDRAVTVLGVDKSVFLRNAIANEAQRVIESSTHHILTAEDAILFASALDKSPPPTRRAVEAAASYQRRVKNAD